MKIRHPMGLHHPVPNLPCAMTVETAFEKCFTSLLEIFLGQCNGVCDTHDILQKRPMILRSLLIVAIPYLGKEPRGVNRVAWSHRMPYLHRSFSTKEP